MGEFGRRVSKASEGGTGRVLLLSQSKMTLKNALGRSTQKEYFSVNHFSVFALLWLKRRKTEKLLTEK